LLILLLVVDLVILIVKRSYTFFEEKILIFVIFKLQGDGECDYPGEQNANLRKKKEEYKIEEK
jgi:hypothetical protein